MPSPDQILPLVDSFNHELDQLAKTVQAVKDSCAAAEGQALRQLAVSREAAGSLAPAEAALALWYAEHVSDIQVSLSQWLAEAPSKLAPISSQAAALADEATKMSAAVREEHLKAQQGIRRLRAAASMCGGRLPRWLKRALVAIVLQL